VQFVKLEPPGTLCQHAAIFDMLKGIHAHSFVEVGCGTGDLSYKLCQRGYTGVGIDFSDSALEQAEHKLKPYLVSGQFRLLKSDLRDLDRLAEYTHQFDLALSMMVMEHVADDAGFVCNLSQLVKDHGHVLLGVPGRRDRWGIEDETVGHLRRYERDELAHKMQTQLSQVRVWSVAVPVANLLFFAGNQLLRRSDEVHKRRLSVEDQTKTSGLQAIPFKTVFPASFSLVLNRFTLSPLFLLQRLFYPTRLGLTLLGLGQLRRAEPR
jgi:SAM-dependent methyltransferase